MPPTMLETAERSGNQKISELLQLAKQRLENRITKESMTLPLLRYNTRN